MKPFWRSSQGKQPSRQNASLVRDALVAIARMVLRRVIFKKALRSLAKAVALRLALPWPMLVSFIGASMARSVRALRRTRTSSPTPATSTCKQSDSGCEDKPVRLQKGGGKGFARQTEAALQSAAYLIARAIKRNGVPGVKYWTEAYETMWPRYAQKIAEAKAKDAALAIEAVIDGINLKLN